MELRKQKAQPSGLSCSIEQMLKASYRDTAEKFPRIKDIFYDFDNGKFIDSSGDEVAISDPRGEDTGKRFSITSRPGPNLVKEARIAGLRAGETTLKRAALSNTFLREEAGGPVWGSVSEFLRRWAGGEVVKDFVGIAYSRSGNHDEASKYQFSRSSILGDSGRQYMPEQNAAMERTGCFSG